MVKKIRERIEFYNTAAHEFDNNIKFSLYHWAINWTYISGSLKYTPIIHLLQKECWQTSKMLIGRLISSKHTAQVLSVGIWNIILVYI